MKPREFTGKCAICGKEMKGPQYGEGEFHDVCCKCFEIRFWDLIKQQVARGETYIINGSAYTRGHRGGFGNRTLRIKMLATGEVKTFEAVSYTHLTLPTIRLV